MATNSKKRTRNFGYIRKLKTGFQASYIDSKGKRHYAPSIFKSKLEANRYLSAMQTEITKGSWRDPMQGKITLRQWWNRYSATRTDWRARTRAGNEYRADRFLLADLNGFSIAERRIDSITPTDIRQWWAAVQDFAEQSALANQKRRFNEERQARHWAQSNGIEVASSGRVSPKIVDLYKVNAAQELNTQTEKLNRPGATSAAQSYRLLHQLFEAAVTDEIILSNPCRIKGAGSVKAIERTPANPQQIEQLASAVPAHYRAAVLVAAYSGLRAGELFALQRKDFDSSFRTLRVDKAILELPNRSPEIGDTKNHSSRRSVILPKSISKELERHLLRFSNSIDRNSLIFATATGGIVTKAERAHWWDTARRKVGLPNLRWHDLRHTGLTIASIAGATIPELKAMAGHSTDRAALHYQHKAQGLGRGEVIASKVELIIRQNQTA